MILTDNSILHNESDILLSYGGVFTQSLIAGMTGVLEKEIEAAELPMKISNNIFVIFIELAQNIMNYAKKTNLEDKTDPKGIITVNKKENNYIICAHNIITEDDKTKIEPLLEFIQNASEDAIKQKYKEIRKKSRNSEEKGSGLGFLEIAKKTQNIQYGFKNMDKGIFSFKICAVI